MTETPWKATTAPPERRPSALMRWVPMAGLAVLFATFARAAAEPISDPDAWWHLRVGHQFWSGEWSLWRTGPLSSFATEEWTPRDWIPQMVASKVEDWFGLPGVAWLYGAALVVFLSCGYLICRRVADPVPATIALTLAAVGASGSLSQRPQIVSLIFMMIAVSGWVGSTRDLKPRWWLIPLTWLWAASHGMWYCVVALGLAAVAGIALDRRANRHQVLQLLAVPVLSLATAAVTPVGPRLLLTLFDTTSMWQFVSEWQPPSFRELTPAVTMFMILIVVVTWARRGEPTPWSHIALLSVATGWTLLSARTVALGAVVMATLVADVIHSWQARRESSSVRHSEAVVLGGIVLSSLAALAVAVPSTSQTPGGVPNGFNDELDALPANTPVLNEYTLGGWLHWRHPGLEAVVDGFTDGYTPEAVAAYADAMAGKPGWDDYVERTQAEVAVLQADAPLADALSRIGWTETARESGFLLLEDRD